MRYQDKVESAQLLPANYEPDERSKAGTKQCTALFMEDWPAPPKCDNEDQMDDLMKIEVRKWRQQTLLAVQPFGIPTLALGQAYEKMFGTPFNLSDFECDNIIPELAKKMADILIVQEPDETTPILFPEYPNDKIFHDARLGHDFSQPNLDCEHLISSVSSGQTKDDSNDLILRAWLDRDLDFPEDVVLVGEPYEELCKVALAMLPNSRGLYRATIVSSGTPDSIFIRLKPTDEIQERIHRLSAEIAQYFHKTKHPIDAYNVPEEFITQNFPCLLYSATEKNWVRCVVVGRSRDDSKVYVESIDFGGIYAVNKIFLYLMPRKFLDIPRLTLEVSLAGIKPAKGSTWSKTVGTRLRCFSISNYFLDILLMDSKKPVKSSNVKIIDDPIPLNTSFNSVESTEASRTSTSGSQKKLKLRKRFANRASYSAIVVDRNDDDMDLFLDEVLTLETYAIEDPEEADQIKQMKARLGRVFEKIPKPTNPLKPIFDRFADNKHSESVI